jgi:hypothetical protein
LTVGERVSQNSPRPDCVANLLSDHWFGVCDRSEKRFPGGRAVGADLALLGSAHICADSVRRVVCARLNHEVRTLCSCGEAAMCADLKRSTIAS